MSSKLDELCALLADAPASIIIQTHDVPDPDALAAAYALQYLLAQRSLPAKIVYNSRIEKSDSQVMLELFGIPAAEVQAGDKISETDWAILVDTQKNSGNVLDLPCREVAVIDHHQLRNDVAWCFADIRPEAGSCSSILTEYFTENSIPIPQGMATALLYGLLIDTDYLLRGCSPLDLRALPILHEHADLAILRALRSSQLSRGDLLLYAQGFSRVDFWENIGFLELGPANDSLIGAANDLLLSVRDIDLAICYSVRERDVKYSIRSSDPGIKANRLAGAIAAGLGFGGGHSHMAGGSLPLDRLPKGQPVGLLIRHRAISFMENAGN